MQRFAPILKLLAKPGVRPIRRPRVSAADPLDIVATESFYAQRGTWYTAFIRTIGTNMQMWLQERDGALPWEDAMRVTPPTVTTNALRVETTQKFRVTFVLQTYANPSAIHVADLNVVAWPECAEEPEIVDIGGVLEATPPVLDCDCVETN